MADNYIEKQYEQYEARKAAWEKARKYGKKKTSTASKSKADISAESNLSPKRAFVTGGDNETDGGMTKK